MKPLIYYDFKSLNPAEVAVNKERLKEILEEVYQAGFQDGVNSKKNTDWNQPPLFRTKDIGYEPTVGLLNNQPRSIQDESKPMPNVTIMCQDTN